MSEPVPEFTDEKIAAFRKAVDAALDLMRSFPFEAWSRISKQNNLDRESKMAVEAMHAGVEAMKSCSTDLELSIKTMKEYTLLLRELSGSANQFNSEWSKVKNIADTPEFKTLQAVLEMHKSGLLSKICYLANEIPGPERSVGTSAPRCACPTSEAT